jgi:hypothetical protein
VSCAWSAGEIKGLGGVAIAATPLRLKVTTLPNRAIWNRNIGKNGYGFCNSILGTAWVMRWSDESNVQGYSTMHPSDVPSPLVTLSHRPKLRWPALAIAVGAAVVGLGTTILPPASAQIRSVPVSQSPMLQTITVTGQCTSQNSSRSPARGVAALFSSGGTPQVSLGAKAPNNRN